LNANGSKPQGEEAAGAPGTALEPVRPPPLKFQPMLVATLIGAIILAITIGAFWTTF
jgi:hypothetical protein